MAQNQEIIGGSRIASLTARLTGLAAGLSGYDEAELSPDHTFLELGFDSLFLTQLATTYQKEFNTTITFRQLMVETPSINVLAAHLDQTLPAEPVAASAAPLVEPPAEPAVTTPPVFAATPPAAGGGIITRDGLAAVLAEQLALMGQQIELLRSAREGAARRTPEQVSAKSAARDDAPPQTPALPDGYAILAGAGNARAPLTLEQQAHIDRLAARYNAKTAGSKARTQDDRAHHADPRTAAGFNPLWKEMVYPIVVKKSRGAYLWDIDDNQYIDLLNGFGPNYFGHGAPFITDALKAQLEDGYELGPQTPRAGDAARLLCELTGMDRASWVNTGSEAVQAAIRIARTVTGRDKIVVFKGDYHGNFDEVLVRGVVSSKGSQTLPLAPGIPSRSVENVIVAEYGEQSALDTISENASEVAAVLVEPIQSRRPEFQPREFLHELRALTEREGIALVFDEVITGFRTCPGGAQEYFGVKADLATYGKIIGGGMPIGVVAGRSKFMDTFDGGMWQYGDDSIPSAGVTFFAGTFVRHPMAIAAAYASLEYLKAAGPGLQQRVNAMAARMASELNVFFKERGVDIFVAQFASQMFIRVNEESELATLFFYHMRERGIHVMEGFPCYMTAAHSDADVDAIIAAAKDSILEMQADGVLARPPGETGPVSDWARKLPLTSSQQEVWIAAQMGELASCAFNESDSIIIEGRLDAALFRAAVEETFRATEAFNLRFDPDGAYQWVDLNSAHHLATTDFSACSPDESDLKLAALFRELALTPFNLESGPVAKINLVRLREDKHLFIIYCHHIVFDGYSADLVMREIARKYTAKVTGVETSPTLTPFSVYAARRARAEAVPDYWREVFDDGAPAALDIPSDRPRAARRKFNGALARRTLSEDLSASIKMTARRIGVSQMTLLFTAYSALLSRLSAQEDLVIGIPAAGQALHKTEAVGYCVNILPVRTAPVFEAGFDAFACDVQKSVLGAFENQDVSIGALINELAIPRDPSRLSLIETVFNFRSYFSDLEMPECKLSAHENRRYAVYYDLFFNIAEAGGVLHIDWDYSADLFDAETIERWIDHYLALLGDIVGNPGKIIGDLSLVSPAGGDGAMLTSRPQ